MGENRNGETREEIKGIPLFIYTKELQMTAIDLGIYFS